MKVLLGVCGGIAAYKSVELMRALQREGCEVRVVMTAAAERFVGALTFESLSGHRVFRDLWADERGEIEHISQAQWAEVMVVAPATANTMAKMAQGMADDFLTASLLAFRGRVVVAPAMNVAMWGHAATRENVETLQKRGCEFVEPESGFLACGMVGSGRLAEVESIVAAVMRTGGAGVRGLAGETVLVTAGGTREPVDAVRFLGNRSSGKMGYAIAAAAKKRGARVILVSAAKGLEEPAGCEVIRVETAAELREAVMSRLGEASVVVGAAAVADFRVKEVVAGKMERSGTMSLELEATEDVLKAVVQRKAPGTLVVGFAAEMGMDVARAREKMRRKGVDAIVLNDVSRDGVGFDADRNAAVWLCAGESVEIAEAAKSVVAERVLDLVMGLRELRLA